MSVMVLNDEVLVRLAIAVVLTNKLDYQSEEEGIVPATQFVYTRLKMYNDLAYNTRYRIHNNEVSVLVLDKKYLDKVWRVSTRMQEEVWNSSHCYDYQVCELGGWESTDLYQWLTKMMEVLHSAMLWKSSRPKLPDMLATESIWETSALDPTPNKCKLYVNGGWSSCGLHVDSNLKSVSVSNVYEVIQC